MTSSGEYFRVGPMRCRRRELEKPLTLPLLLSPFYIQPLLPQIVVTLFIVPTLSFQHPTKMCMHCSGWCHAISDICWTTGERNQEDLDNWKQIKFSKSREIQHNFSISSTGRTLCEEERECLNNKCWVQKSHPGWKTPFAFSFVGARVKEVILISD